MPLADINEKMILLEEAIENTMDSSKQFQHAYSRTGNNLKEFVYYSSSQNKFMNLLNKTLAGHERYPIEINFYEDPEWSEFKKLIEDLKNKNDSTTRCIVHTLRDTHHTQTVRHNMY